VTTSTRIVLTSAQRALLTAVADVTDELGTASLAMAAERVKRRAPDVREDAAALLRLGLVDRLQPDVVMLGRGWTTLGRMPRPRLGPAAEATAPNVPQLEMVPPDPEPTTALPEAPEPGPRTAKAAMLAYALAATRPVSAREIASATGTPVPTAKVTLRSLAREGRLAHCIIDGAAHYGAPTPPDASSVEPDPAGDAGPGVIAPPPAVDDQAREGSACGESCPASEGSGDVDEAPPGDPVEELSGGGDAAAGALASRSEYEIAIRLKTAIFAGGLGEVLGRPVEPHATKLHIYVATGLEHAHRAWLVGYALRAAGHAITYDWTTHGSVQGEGFARLAEVAQAERDGVAVADLVIAILPGGRGTHVEIGMALGYGIPVALLIQNGCYDAECAFYSLPEIDRRAWATLTELIDGAVGAAAMIAAELDEGHVESPDPFFDAPVPSKAAIVEHAERHGDSAQELVASLPAMVELLLEYDVTVDPTTAPGGPLVHAVRRALSVSQDRGIALATTDGVVGELHARCQDYAELAAELRGAATRIPSLAAAANDLEARIAVVRGAAAIVQAEVASA